MVHEIAESAVPKISLGILRNDSMKISLSSDYSQNGPGALDSSCKT